MDKELEKTAPLPAENLDGGTPQEPGGASAGVPPTTNDQNTNYKQQFLDNISAKYGEMDEEEMYRRLMEDYDRDHEYNKMSREDNEKLREIMENDPDFAEFAKDMASNGDVMGAMRHMPEDVATYGAENFEGRKKLLEEERNERAGIEEELRSTQANLAKSEEVMREYVQKSGMSAEEAEEVMSFLSNEVIDKIGKGIITPEMLELFDKGRKYDADMEVAKKAGEVVGRNAQISEKRKRFDHSFDGLPTGGGSGSSAGIEEVKEDDPTVAWLKGVNSRAKR